MENKAKTFWENLSPDNKLEILSENDFWDGFSHYKYEYLPEDLKEFIRCKINAIC